ncbi:S8 family peptidase [Lacrimispora aerotolerans]|uniref:S8 family peptidase n=1 Tax=Lacrimispora aerotolerans TaxID=36832 RepID=UPI00047C010F|nr:S8 family peptidase [Lacrimispora aerotolerans]
MQKILDNEYYDLIISNALIPESVDKGNVTMINDKHSLLHLHRSQMNACDLGIYPYSSFPSLYTLASKVSVEKSGIGSIQREPGLNLFGLGIIIGIIDTGIDYQHPAFRNHDGSSRILSIWDQTDQNGTPPKGFEFGSVYTKTNIDTALMSTAPLSIVPSVDTHGHGTAIASIISGTPNQEHSFMGVAPQTKLAVVKLKEAKKSLKDIFAVPEDALCYQESDIMLGIRFLLSLARQLSRPVIICIALGSSQGGHGGRSALSSYIDSIVNLQRTNVTVAAGNEADKRRHYYHNITSPPFENEFYLNVGEQDKRFSMEIWPFPPGRITLDIVSPNGEFLEGRPPSLNRCEKYQLIADNSCVWVNNIDMDGETGDQVILARFENPIPGPWLLKIHSMENEPFFVHAWLPSGNLITNKTYFQISTPNTTITSPGNSKNPLTVAAYNQFFDLILEESGRGYTRFGDVVPDIAAPGYRIPCAIPGNQYGTLTGSGAACAHATGVAAMVMEWGFARGNYTEMTGLQVNRMIIRGARRNDLYQYPNNIWGYGQVDIYHIFERLSVV